MAEPGGGRLAVVARRVRDAAARVREQPAETPEILLPAEPLSREFGFERPGRPIDRWYIERFLERHRRDVRGRVLEVAEDTYTQWYGDGEVTANDVLYAAEGEPAATVVGDLTTGRGLPPAAYDCFICTQTFPFIYDVRAAIAGARDVLAPGGVLLATLPALSQTSRLDRQRWGDWWRFTSQSAERLFGEAFGAEHVTVSAHGNVRVAAAFLYGLGSDELELADLERDDDEYELLITVRAVRGA